MGVWLDSGSELLITHSANSWTAIKKIKQKRKNKGEIDFFVIKTMESYKMFSCNKGRKSLEENGKKRKGNK